MWNVKEKRLATKKEREATYKFYGDDTKELQDQWNEWDSNFPKFWNQQKLGNLKERSK